MRPMSKAFGYCVDLVKKHDCEGYLTALMFPTAVQDAVFAIRAFNVETALIQDQAKQRQFAKSRLDFWREVIQTSFASDKPRLLPKTPLAIHLHSVIRRYRLSADAFYRLLDARAAILAVLPFANLDELVAYADASSASLVRLSLDVLDASSPQLMDAARCVGVACGLATVVCGMLPHLQQHKVVLPTALLQQVGVSPEQLLAGSADLARLRPAVRQIVDCAADQLSRYRALQNADTARHYAAFAPAVAARHRLRTLVASDYDAFAPVVYQRLRWLPLQLGVYRLRRRL